MKNRGVCVTAFIRNGDKVLVALRAADDSFLPGYWEQVGGSLDWGEEPSTGLIREVKEETGLSIEVIKPYSVSHYIDEEEDSIVEISYICKVVGSNEVALSSEHQEYRWVTIDEVDSLSPITPMVVEAIKAGFHEK